MAAATAQPDWGTDALRQRLAPLLPGLQVQCVAEVDSTNTRLVERARLDRSACLLVAQAQTAGRGRMQRAWVSAPGASLTFSLALPLAPASWSGLSLAVGVALAEALSPGVGIKWPNDLWFDGRKLGGILIETVPHGDERIAVVGIGLNVAPQPVAGSACTQEIDAVALADPSRVLARVALPLVRALLDFQAHGFAAVMPAYAARDVLQGRPVHTAQAGGSAGEGIADGVEADGALRLRLADGSRQRITSGEVSVRLAPGPA
jgi:BirA family biotin operon repressor/biotin-[acetyl-CoA-carboxylase] ligase